MSAIGIAVAIAVFTPDGESTLRSAARFHDFLHVPGLALVAVLLLAAFPVPARTDAGGDRGESGRRPRIRTLRAGRLLAVFLAALAVGVLIELLQALSGRVVSGGDVARDAAGAAAAVLGAAAWEAGVRPVVRGVLLTGALLIVAAFAVPTVEALWEEHLARRQFPVLADFTRPEELDRFDWNHSTPSWTAAADGHRAVHVTLWPGRYPGFALEYFPGDWRGYRHLVLAAANPAGAPLPMVIRIDDEQHNQHFDDRFNARFVLAPGWNEIRVPLAEVEAAPRGRRLDLSRVEQVIVFSHGLRERRDLVLESLRLER